jgi:hypothetical protein
MRNAWWAILFLAGCSSMTADYKPAETVDSSKIFSITSSYDGEMGSKERTSAALDIDARNLCMSGYTLISEESHPIMNRIGEVTYLRLVWEIKCNARAETALPKSDRD